MYTVFVQIQVTLYIDNVTETSGLIILY